MTKSVESVDTINVAESSAERRRWTASTVLAALAPRATMIAFGAILILWINRAEGGIGVSANNVFGYHALLMGLFTVGFTQEALLAYSAPLWGPFVPSRTVIKFFHSTLHFLGIVCCVCGLVAAAKDKSDAGTPVVFPNYTLFSAHSWVGVAALTLWALQFIGGFVLYLFATLEVKKKASKYHKFLGSVVYAALLATCAMGLEDAQQSDLSGSTPPFNFTADLAANATGAITGYLPDSDLSRYAASGSVLLVVCGLFTFLNRV
ncbi:eukaryotic cytochrome b561-domain-containing protein [Blyttiomyces helicus]|uniref:Eukaryotic cytochrome b561-domain-containing protein n=1 Tax=Blyttiomyces helicus TaxID=388810 RepID=A0A4P9VYL0_9FUNG|nr:eukaryotic cytochrome b561-domain-containing protein [Blyttiomyces helicus]|eukprot:RKO84879.1 eukaryotic cytochrome b561-domain-containing protein [Blyttiomyces helicus]